MKQLIVGSAVFAVAVGFAATTHADEPKPCAAKSFKVAKVESACKAGGQKAAKTLMQTAVKKAKASGESMTCKTCHTSLSDFALKPDAVAQLNKWL